LHQTAASLAKVCESKGLVLLSGHNEQDQKAPKDHGLGREAKFVPIVAYSAAGWRAAASIMLLLQQSVPYPNSA
jgi:hypothetical protein